MKFGQNGVTKGTPQKIIFGAGTIHKGLKYSGGSWNFAESIVGATSGGSKVTITPEIQDIEVDGMWVAAKGLKAKVGETAEMEINFAEITKEIVKASVLGNDGESADETYYLIESKGAIEDGDYWENIAYVGKTLAGKNIIVVMDNALCTSGLALDAKDKDGVYPAVTFACHSTIDGDGETLPYHIYYPKVTA